MSFIQNIPGFINHVEPHPVLPVPLVKTEVVHNEPPDSEIVEIGEDILGTSELDEEAIVDIKDIEIVSHPLCEYSIKSETVPTNILETKHSEDFVKTENSPFVKIENITESETLIKTEDTSNGNGQEVTEVQDLNKHSNTLDNLLINSSDLNGISSRNRKTKYPEKTNFAECFKTVEITSWKKDKEKIKVIKAPVIPVEPHEYTSLAKDKRVCNHCQHTCNNLNNLKTHIKQMHRKIATMYQCPYCPYKSKWSIQGHIIQKHKDAKDIQWFQCHFCEKKFKLKCNFTQHLKVHEQTQDNKKIELCPICGKGFALTSSVKRHMRFIHNKEKRNKGKRKCRECEYITTKRHLLELHIKNTHENYEKRWYHCDECDYKTDTYNSLKRHELIHLKPEEIQYFYCYHCSYKSKQKGSLKIHIFRHFKNKNWYRYCDKCDYKTCTSANLKRHKLIHLKPEEIQYFYCYHCSYKSKRKGTLKVHIFNHFKNGDVPFDCYICNYMIRKREAIVEHIEKHSKLQIKSEIIEES